MGKIQVLDKQVAELIAAGEVVERPSSVVKELIENSLDAGATAVTVEIMRGGVTYMRVTDNGSGIASEDAESAFLRHATSKVRTAQDLQAIGTLGFRGEALAAVSAVSRVELITRTEEEQEGTLLRVEGGEVVSREPAGCPVGATLIIRDLFFNTPGRMKFLKKDATEAAAVASVVDKIALARPDVSLRLIRDGRETLFSPGGGVLSGAVAAVYGRELARSMLPVRYELNGIEVTGCTGRPEASRVNRNFQNFFLNGRTIRSRLLGFAVEDAYKTLVAVERYPACVIGVTMNPALVDVNVHPSKLEVKFANERMVYDAVFFAVKSAISQMEERVRVQLRESAPFEGQKGEQQALKPPPSPPQQYPWGFPPIEKAPATAPQVAPTPLQPVIREDDVPLPPAPLEPRREAFVHTASETFTVSMEVADEPLPYLAEPQPSDQAPEPQGSPVRETSVPEPPKPETTESPAAPPSPPEFRYIGEAFHAYVIAQQGDELLLVDKHAAQERILYERLKTAMAGRGHSQTLLTPAVVTLSREELAHVTENLAFFTGMGYDIEEFGEGTLLVRGLPSELGEVDAGALLQELAGQLLAGKKEPRPQLLDRLLFSMACKAAMKAGQRNAPEDLRNLISQLLSLPDIRYCPHGRPVLMTLTKKDLERQFGR